jgi:hypothetical protein
VSALCGTRAGRAMTPRLRTRRFISITARPTPDEKKRFGELAKARGLSESQLAILAILAIRTYLELARYGPPLLAKVVTEPATDRITIRLRPGDRQAIGWRASNRGTAASNYIAGLVRAHVAGSPPLMKQELQALKGSVAVLAVSVRVAHQLARNALATGQLPTELRQELSSMGAAIKGLEQATRDFTRAALITWETNYG